MSSRFPYAEDCRVINELTAAWYKALSWNPDKKPNWDTVLSLFAPDAHMVPSARPAKITPPKEWIARMEKQRVDGSLQYFEAEQLQGNAFVFGNIAVQLHYYRSLADQVRVHHGLSALVFVLSDGRWECVSMAWDGETDEKKIPEEYKRNFSFAGGA